MRFLIKSAPNRGNARGKHDVVGEYAVYMMAKGPPECPQKRCFRSFPGGENLDALPLSPYTSAVPWMDMILNPASHPETGTKGGMEEDLLRCRGAAN